MKEHILSDDIYMKCPGQANLSGQYIDQWFSVVEEREEEGVITKVWNNENVLNVYSDGHYITQQIY